MTRIVGGPAAHPDNERPASGRAGWMVARVSVGGISMEAGQVPDVSDVGDVYADADRLLTTAEVSALLGIVSGTWSGYVSRGLAPPADDPDAGRHPSRSMPRWRLGTVQAWNDARRGSGNRTRGPRGEAR